MTVPDPARAAPSLGALFRCFLGIGAMSFGGGMSAWVRREVVQKRGWLDDGQFLSGVALSQIAPGANGVNLAVCVGTALRGSLGALAALAGMLAVPLVLVVAAGAAYAASRGLPGAGWLGAVLAGMGAAAIGLNLATGLRLARRNIVDLPGACVAAFTALAIGVLRWKLLPVLALAIPASLCLTLLRRGAR